MTEGKTIGNVNILDLRKTTEEAIAGIRKIGNVNVLLYSAATASYISRLDMGNINASIEAPPEGETRMIMGHLRLTPDSLSNEGGSGFCVVMGHVIVEMGTDIDAMKTSLERISGLVVMGHVFCPESLCSLIQQKVKQQMGHFIPYPDDATLVGGSLDLTAGFLEQIEGSTGFVVIGSLRATEEIPETLMRKAAYFQVRGSVLCAERNAEALQAKLQSGTSELTIIPSGYRFHEGDLTLDAATLESLTNAKLFCTGNVRFEEDATAEAVETGIAGLRSLGLIVCPETLQDTAKTRLDLVADRVIFYSGRLWLFDQDHTLHASRFDYTEGKITALVTGDLRIEPDVEPSVLADRLLVVHNFGDIRCTSEQMGAIEARLGIQKGDLSVAKPKEEGEKYDIGNANILAL